MKYRNLKKWDDLAQCESLVYFAQSIDEMLFDYSLDTYKASVMHTGLLCLEATRTIKEIEAGNIMLPNIHHVTAELCLNFEKDPVAQALVSLPLNAFVPALKNPKTPLKELRTVLELLQVQLYSARYRAKNEELLVSEIKTGHRISEIRRLTRSLVTELIASGLSRRFIRDTTQKFFFYGKDRIGNTDAIDDFLVLLPKERKEFTVVFKLDVVFESAAKAFSSVDIDITKKVPDGLDLAAFPTFASDGEQSLYAIVGKTQALDIYSARSMAERRVNLCSTLLSLFHHRKSATWASESIVYDHANKKYSRVGESINPMMRCSDLVQTVAANRLTTFMAEFSLEKNSFDKFIRSAQLHAMALKSDAAENQILNIWIALESLVPSETRAENVSNIEHIVDSTVPFLNIGYIERLLNNLVKDLLKWNHAATRQALKSVPGTKFVHKLAKLLSLDEFKDERAALVDQFRDFHLLRDRFGYFQDVLKTPQSVIAALDAHRQRLEWQIRRIYRTRNIIVHSGHTPAHTSTLIEHAHDYLDTVLSSLIKMASRPKVINSVAQGFKQADLSYSMYCKNLEPKGLAFSGDNIDCLLFSRIGATEAEE